MGTYYETKHDAYNLKFKEHEVFKGELVVVDESDIPFIWLDKETGKVSFGGKYFRLYKEQRLLEVLMEFVYKVSGYVHGSNENVDYFDEFEKALKKFDELQHDFKINQSSKEFKFFEVTKPYYALIKAENAEKAVKEYVHSVAGDEDGTLIDEIVEVERDYAVARYSRAKSEDGKEVLLKEILEDIRSDKNVVLIVDGALA